MTTKRIRQEKNNLVKIAEKHGMDFQHPEVLAKSHEIDRLIVEQMQNECNVKSGI